MLHGSDTFSFHQTWFGNFAEMSRAYILFLPSNLYDSLLVVFFFFFIVCFVLGFFVGTFIL